MMIYLDDDSTASQLVRALRQAGHDVRTPAEAGLAGAMTRSTCAKRSEKVAPSCRGTTGISSRLTF
jgi:hypothetical protein